MKIMKASFLWHIYLKWLEYNQESTEVWFNKVRRYVQGLGLIPQHFPYTEVSKAFQLSPPLNAVSALSAWPHHHQWIRLGCTSTNFIMLLYTNLWSGHTCTMCSVLIITPQEVHYRAGKGVKEGNQNYERDGSTFLTRKCQNVGTRFRLEERQLRGYVAETDKNIKLWRKPV